MMSQKSVSDEMSLEQVADVSEKDIPITVDKCVGTLAAIQSKVSEAIDKATQAVSLSNDAKAVKLHWYKFGDKAEAIDALQKAMEGVASAQDVQVDAIKQLLEYQETVAKGMKFLLALGVSNMSNSRIVVRRLEMKLKGASEEELSEMARNEMRAVIAQIKAQLDLQERQDRLAADQKRVKEKVRSAAQDIGLLSQHEEEQDRKLAANDKVDEAQNRELRRQAEKGREHDVELQRLGEKEMGQDKQLAENAKKIEENASGVAANAAGIATNAKNIAGNAEGVGRNAEAIADVRKVLKVQRHALAGAKMGNGVGRMAFWMSCVSLLISIATAICLFVHAVAHCAR